MKMIYVFKTTVKNKKAIKRVKPHLEALIPDFSWNFDLKDCDNIFRVECDNEVKLEIVKILNQLDFECEELPD